MSDTAFPDNGGWIFRQAQTNWKNPMALVGKSASIEAIRKHRLANPAITAKHNLATDPAAIEQELIDTSRRAGAAPDGATSVFSAGPQQPARPSGGGCCGR